MTPALRGSTLSSADELDRLSQPQKFHYANAPPVEVNLVPRKSMPRRGWVSMVIIVPPFAKGQQRDPPIIPRIIVGNEAARAPHVCSRVNQPCRMQVESDAEENAPHQIWPTAEDEQRHAK